MTTQKPLDIIIVDDEFLVGHDLKRMLGELGHRVTGLFTTIGEADQFLLTHSPDIVITDIFFDRKPAGLDWVKTLRSRRIPYLLITGSTPSALLEVAADTDAHSFIFKPLRKREVFIRLEMINLTDSLSPPRRFPKLQIRQGGRKVLISTHKINYIESDRNEYVLHTSTRKFIGTGTLSELLDVLPTAHFTQIHRSYLINLCRVRDYSARNIRLDNGAVLPIGRKYKPDLVRIIREWTRQHP